MKGAAVSKRYARALADFAGSLEDARELTGELELFHKVVEDSDDLRQVLLNPAFLNERAGVVKAMANAMELDEKSVQALLYLLERDRINILDSIVEALKGILERKTGVVRAELTSSSDLPDDRYEKIREALEKLTGRKIVIEKKIDPEIIGGVITRVGSVVYDGSIKSQLELFKSAH